MHQDYLVKALAYNDQVRAYAVKTTHTIREASRRHQTLATAADALGRSMTASVMMGAMLKGDEKYSIKLEGGGPIGTILIDANAYGDVRGYVSNPKIDLALNEHGHQDVKAAVGMNGLLTVTKDIGMQQPHIGYVPLESGEIGEDFNVYITNSEQVQSSLGVSVLVNADDHTVLAAGGFMIQLLPNTEAEVIQALEARLAELPSIASMLSDGMTPEQMLRVMLGEQNVRVFEQMPVKFQCECSRERISNAITSLGNEEIQDMIDTDGQAEANCHFCNETYHFTKENLEQLLKETA